MSIGDAVSLVRNSGVPKVVLEVMTALWPEPLIELQLVRELNMVGDKGEIRGHDTYPRLLSDSKSWQER
jgi:hypothetical protein